MRPLGDSGSLIDVSDWREARQLAAELRSNGTSDVVPAARTVGLIGTGWEEVDVGRARSSHAPPPEQAEREHLIEVCFDGDDVTDQARLEASVFDLEVAWLGFMPGFAYLAGLPRWLAELPRLARPRPRVPAGSFAVGGGYAGIYPSSSPGGWNLLGRCATALFDAAEPPYALLQPGDRVRLLPVRELAPMPETIRLPLEGDDLEVLEPGFSLIEDLGRVGVGAGALGVPRAGAADELALASANLAVGNRREEAALELMGQVALRAGRDHFAVLSGEGQLTVDGATFPPGLVAAVGAGQVLKVTSRRRAILALGGGIRSPELFASRSADAVTGLPPGLLRAGDRLQLGPSPARARRRLAPSLSGGPSGSGRARCRLRAVPGPDPVGAQVLEQLASSTWRVDGASDRTGTRLDRSRGTSGSLSSRLEGGEEVPSHAVVPGAIQVTPAGEPVILGPDCGPVGGYAVAATVIRADLWRLGSLLPGDEVEIALVSLEVAREARSELDAAIARSSSGWFPTHVA